MERPALCGSLKSPARADPFGSSAVIMAVLKMRIIKRWRKSLPDLKARSPGAPVPEHLAEAVVKALTSGVMPGKQTDLFAQLLPLATWQLIKDSRDVLANDTNGTSAFMRESHRDGHGRETDVYNESKRL